LAAIRRLPPIFEIEQLHHLAGNKVAENQGKNNAKRLQWRGNETQRFLAKFQKRQEDRRRNGEKRSGDQRKARASRLAEQMRCPDRKNKQNLRQDAFNEPKRLNQGRLEIMKKSEEYEVKSGADHA